MSRLVSLDHCYFSLHWDNSKYIFTYAYTHNRDPISRLQGTTFSWKCHVRDGRSQGRHKSTCRTSDKNPEESTGYTRTKVRKRLERDRQTLWDRRGREQTRLVYVSRKVLSHIHGVDGLWKGVWKREERRKEDTRDS